MHTTHYSNQNGKKASWHATVVHYHVTALVPPSQIQNPVRLHFHSVWLQLYVMPRTVHGYVRSKLPQQSMLYNVRLFSIVLVLATVYASTRDSRYNSMTCKIFIPLHPNSNVYDSSHIYMQQHTTARLTIFSRISSSGNVMCTILVLGLTACILKEKVGTTVPSPK